MANIKYLGAFQTMYHRTGYPHCKHHECPKKGGTPFHLSVLNPRLFLHMLFSVLGLGEAITTLQHLPLLQLFSRHFIFFKICLSISFLSFYSCFSSPPLPPVAFRSWLKLIVQGLCIITHAVINPFIKQGDQKGSNRLFRAKLRPALF